MEVIGIQDTAFTLPDGVTRIEGANLTLSYPLDPSRGGQGVGTERIFLSKAKLGALPFRPSLGMSVEPTYSRYGKIQSLRLLDDGLDFGTER